jgi:galactokinase
MPAMPESPTPVSLLAAFREEFGRQANLFRAPGRVNLVGEHTDYNDGFVMPMNTAVFTWVAIRPREDRLVKARSVLFDETVEFELDGMDNSGQNHWSGYLKGVLYVLLDEGYELHGAELLIDGNVPLGGGLSSSASLEAAIATAFLGTAGYTVEPGKLALMCKRAENEFVGVQCGIMDQFVIAGSAFNHAMKLDCRSLEFTQVALPKEVRILVTDTGVKHQLAAGGYNQRREECEASVGLLAAHDVSITALRDVSPQMLHRHRGELGDTLFRRALHVVSENQRVHAAESAIAEQDLPALGRLIDASHDSLRDNFEVSCVELDQLVAVARRCKGVYGSRMVGGGFGGCTMTLVEPAHLERIRDKISREYAESAGKPPWQHVVQPAHPAGKVEE